MRQDEWLVHLGDCESDDKRGVYSVAQAADVLGIPHRRMRAWVKAGLIHPAIEIDGKPFFDFQRVASAKTLCSLADAGISTAQMRCGLERLSAWMGGADEPLQQLVMLERNGQLLVRLEAGLVEPSGQIHFDFDDAFPIFSVRPTSAEEWYEKGCEHEEEGELSSAIRAYREALGLGGPDAEICFNLANALHASGQQTAATERYRFAVELEPGYAEAWNNLGVALGEIGRFDEAKHALTTAEKLGFAEARFNLTWLMARRRQGIG